MNAHNTIPFKYSLRHFLSLRPDKKLDPVGSKDFGKFRKMLNSFARNMRRTFPDSLFFGKIELDKDGETYHAHVDFYPGENVTFDEVTRACFHHWQKQTGSQWHRLIDLKPMCRELTGYFFASDKKERERQFIQKNPGKSFWMMKGFRNLPPAEQEQIHIPLDRMNEAGKILVEDYRHKMKEAGKPENQKVIDNLTSGFVRYFMPSKKAIEQLRALAEPKIKGGEEMGLFVNQKGAAEYLGMNVHTFRSLIKEYPIPKHGPKKNYFEKEELVAWMKGKRWKAVDPVPEAQKQGKRKSKAEMLAACTGPGTNTWGLSIYGLTG